MKEYFRNLKIVLKATIRDFHINKRHQALRKEGSEDVEFATLRMYCHMLDKAMNNPFFERGHSKQIFRDAKVLRDKLAPSFCGDRAFFWVNSIISRFESAQQSGIPLLNNQTVLSYSEQEKGLFKAFIKSRTSCRNFEKKVIPTEIIRNIVDIAIDAPNGCCRQTTKFYITQQDNIINKLVPNVAGITNFTNIPAISVVCSESSYYNLIDKNLQFVDASLAAENFILASRIYNIYGTMCNIFHADDDQIRCIKNLMNIKKSENIVLVIVFGYPTVVPEKPQRQNLNHFFQIV